MISYGDLLKTREDASWLLLYQYRQVFDVIKNIRSKYELFRPLTGL